MPRISTYGSQNSALMDLMRAQQGVFDAQQQVTTGKKATDLKGIGHKAETLSASRASLARSEAYQEAATRTASFLESQEIALERINSSMTDLRVAVTEKQGDFVYGQVEDAFYQVVTALGARHSGGYIFGGTRTDTNPLTISSLDDLQALATAGDAFQNSDRRPSVKLDETVTVETGMLADEVGQEIFEIFKRIADYEAGPNGPFTNPLPGPQETFLINEMNNVVTAIDNLLARTAQNGNAQANVDTIKQSHADRQIFLNIMIADLEDVDMAEAVTKFEQAQVALEVSARTFSTLSQVTLLDYLR